MPSSRVRSIAAVLAADVVSTTGSEVAGVALPWFVLVTTGSPARMGIVMAAEFVGMAGFGIPSGRVATSLGPRRTMIAADAARAPLVALIPALHWAGALSFPVIVAVGVPVGAFFPAHSSSQQVLLATLADDDEVALTRLSGALASVNETASFVGPALGGFLVALVGPATALVVDAGSYIVAAALVGFLVPAVGGRAGAHDAGAVQGLRFLWRDRQLARTICGVAIFEIGFTAMLATLPVAALQHYHASARLAGWLVAAFGAGSIAGGALSSRARSARGRVALFAMPAAALAASASLASLPAWALGAVVGAVGLCSGLFFPRFFATVTLRAPPELRARVAASTNTIVSATGPLGFVAAGFLLQRSGSPVPGFALVAAAFAVGALAVASSGLWTARNAEPVARVETG